MKKEMKCDDPEFLKQLGECYKDLLLIGNKKGHNMYPDADIYVSKEAGFYI